MNSSYLYTRARVCFFCIPVRGGTVVMSSLGMLLGLIMVIIAAVSTDANRTALDVQAALYSVLAVASLFGLIGAIQSRKLLVDVFLWFLLAHAFLSIISGIFVLIVTFQNAAVAIVNCPKGPGQAPCVANIQLNRNIAVPAILLVWALQFYGTWIVKCYRDQLLEETADGDDGEKALIRSMVKADISASVTTYAGPLATPLAANQGTYNPHRTPHQRNFSRPMRGPGYTSEVNLPTAATRTTFPRPVKTMTHSLKRSSSSNSSYSSYFDPTQFYSDQRASQYPDLPLELPPPVPSRYTNTRGRDAHSRSDSGSSSSSQVKSDASSRSRFSADSFISFDSLEQMLNPELERKDSIGSSWSSIGSLRRPPQAVVPVRF